MGKFYRANQELGDYLIQIGLTFHDREESLVQYYTNHSTGGQVKIDQKNKLVSLLDSRGNTVDYSSSYTNNQIEEHVN
jgi:hypothetical protein